MSSSINTLSKWSRVAAGIGFLLLLAAFVLRLRMLFAGTAVVAEGEPFRGTLEEYIPGTLIYDQDLGLPDVAFYPTKLEATQGEQGELLAITAHVRVPDADGDERVFSDTAPLELADASVRVWRINVAPVLAVRYPADAEPTTIVPKLKLWRRDTREERLRVADDTATLYLRLYSDFYTGPDGPATRSMALRDPVLQVRLLPDRPNARRGFALLRPGQSHQFELLELELVELRHWGAVEIAGRRRNHVAYAGLLLLGFGLAGQLVAWGRRRRST